MRISLDSGTEEHFLLFSFVEKFCVIVIAFGYVAVACVSLKKSLCFYCYCYCRFHAKQNEFVEWTNCTGYETRIIMYYITIAKHERPSSYI